MCIQYVYILYVICIYIYIYMSLPAGPPALGGLPEGRGREVNYSSLTFPKVRTARFSKQINNNV